MFQFPRFPPDPYTFRAGCQVSLLTDCSIRAPPDLRVGAAPRGISPRPRALHRPRRPRHPPRAHPCAANIFVSTKHRDSYGRFLCIPVVDRGSQSHHRFYEGTVRRAVVITARDNVLRTFRIIRLSMYPRATPAEAVCRLGSPHGHPSAMSHKMVTTADRWPPGDPVRFRSDQVEPRGLEPRTSAVQGRRSPN
jgi:hypothetical protein